MLVRHAGVIRFGSAADGGERFMAVVRCIMVLEDACGLSLRPVSEIHLHSTGVRSKALELRPFTLTIKGGKARFDRDIRLPHHLREYGLGTYFLSTLVRTAVLLGHGGARVGGLNLIKRDHTPLRTGFYRAMHFRVQMGREGSGFARAGLLSELRMDYNHEKIHELDHGELSALGARY